MPALFWCRLDRFFPNRYRYHLGLGQNYYGITVHLRKMSSVFECIWISNTLDVLIYCISVLVWSPFLVPYGTFTLLYPPFKCNPSRAHSLSVDLQYILDLFCYFWSRRSDVNWNSLYGGRLRKSYLLLEALDCAASTTKSNQPKTWSGNLKHLSPPNPLSFIFTQGFSRPVPWKSRPSFCHGDRCWRVRRRCRLRVLYQQHKTRLTSSTVRCSLGIFRRRLSLLPYRHVLCLF